MLMRIFKPMMLMLQAVILMKLTLSWWSHAAKDALIKRISRFKKK